MAEDIKPHEQKAHITVVSGIKGGGTKSTDAQILGTGLEYVATQFAPNATKPVPLLVDHDPQATLSAFNGVKDQERKTIVHVLRGEATLEEIIIKKGSFEKEVVIKKGNREEVVIRKVPLVDIIPGNQSLHQMDLMYPGSKYPIGIIEFAELLRTTNLPYTHIIIDTPGTVGPIHLPQALAAADDVILPVVPDSANFEVFDQTVDVIRDVQRSSNRNLKINGILVARAARTTVSSKYMQIIQEVAELLGTNTYYATIREQNMIKDAQDQLFPFYERMDTRQAHDCIAFIAEYLGIFSREKSKEYLEYMDANLKE